MIQIRPAIDFDAPAIAHVEREASLEAYRPIFGHQFHPQSSEDRLPVWQDLLQAGSGLIAFVAEQQGEVVGYAGWGANRDGLATNTGELRVLYVRPALWRRGIGSSLLETAEFKLAELGFERAVLWVLEKNLHARRFYESRGWSSDGEFKLLSRLPGFREVRYARKLNNPAG